MLNASRRFVLPHRTLKPSVHLTRAVSQNVVKQEPPSTKQEPRRTSWKDDLQDEPTPVFRWGATINKISNFAVIPFALLYAVFFADFGEHEHIFSPPRRWLDQQKAAFFSLSPAEQELVRKSNVTAQEDDSPTASTSSP